MKIMTRKIHLFLIVYMMLVSFPIYAAGKYDVSRITSEAEDFIDRQSEVNSDRISDAILHSLQGNISELEQYRKACENKEDFKIESDIENLSFNETKITLYKPKHFDSERCRVFFYFPTGNWILDQSKISGVFCDKLAQEGEMIVACVNYPLTPEHQYKEIVDCCYEMVMQTVLKLNSEGFNQLEINLGGEGAGGTIALSETIKLLKNSDKNVQHLVLYSPYLRKEVIKSESRRKYSRGYTLDRRLAESCLEAVLGISPHSLEANSEFFYDLSDGTSFKTFPETLLITPERTILLDDCLLFRDKLQEDGHKVNDLVLEGAVAELTTGEQPTAMSLIIEETIKFLSGNK